jgi:hypothetical protein
MAYFVTYLAKNYNIPPRLLVNIDQIGMHVGCWHGGVDQFQHHKGIFFCSGCDCKCYILLHILGFINRDSFSNNIL